MRSQNKSGSDQRRKKRLEAKAKAKAKGNGASEFVTRKEVNEAFQTYADNLRRLADLFNENQRALRNAFELVDAHQAVMRRLAHDSMWGQIRPIPLHPNDAQDIANGCFSDTRVFMKREGQIIDYEWYFEQYNFAQAIIAMALAIRRFLKLDEQPTQAEQKPEADFVFGGDYGENQVNG